MDNKNGTQPVPQQQKKKQSKLEWLIVVVLTFFIGLNLLGFVTGST